MSLWALSGNMIGKAFNDGFNQGFNTADKEMLERRQLQYKLDLERKEKERQAKQLGDLADMVTGRDKFESNYTPQRLNIFDEAQNSTPIPLQATQEPQASPNNNNINYSSLFNAYKTNGSPVNQETLNNGTQNYREAFNTWKADKPYTNEYWALADALKDGNYSAVALMGKELDKIFNPAYSTREYFDPNKSMYMAQPLVNYKPVGEAYPLKPHESSYDKYRARSIYGGWGNSNKNQFKPIVLNGVEHNAVMDNQGRIIKVLGVTESALDNFSKQQTKNGYPPEIVNLGRMALSVTGNLKIANDVLNGRFATGGKIVGGDYFGENEVDLLDGLNAYDLETDSIPKDINGNEGDIVNEIHKYVNDVADLVREYGNEVLSFIPIADNEVFLTLLDRNLRGKSSTPPSNNNREIKLW